MIRDRQAEPVDAVRSGVVGAGPPRASAARGARLVALALVLTLASTTVGCGDGEAARPAPAPLTVVLIVVDTLRADHLGVYAYRRPTTPHIDAWAASGRVYLNSLSASPWTLPSMASLLSGQRPARHRAGQLPLVDGEKPGFAKRPEDLRPMRSDISTLAERLAERGWVSGAFVTNSFLARRFGVARGFGHYDQANAFATQARRADATVDAALAWVDEQATRPRLLMVHLFDPHLGYDAPPPMRGRFTTPLSGGRYALPFLGEKGLSFGLVPLEERDRDFIRAAYDEEVAWVDAEIERLRAGLAARGWLDDAVVVLTSDHGEEFFEHDGFEHGHALWQPILHVPLIVWGPGVVPGREPALVSAIDVLPTLLDAVGADADPELPGRSLWPNATTGAALPAVPIYAEQNVYGPRQRAIIEWPDKLTHIVERDVTLLFDLSVDPDERDDLSAERPERARALLEKMTRRIGEDELRSEVGPEPEDEAMDAETSESLRSLGYIE